MPLAQHIQKDVRATVQAVPLAYRDVRGVPGHPNIFISRKDSHNSWPIIGSIKMGDDVMVNVFEAKMS